MALIACDCSVDIDERADKSLVRTMVARKEHVCCECGEKITRGQEFELYNIQWFDVWVSYKTCIPCTRIRGHYCAHGFHFGMLREQIEDCLGFDYTEIPEEDEE